MKFSSVRHLLLVLSLAPNHAAFATNSTSEGSEGGLRGLKQNRKEWKKDKVARPNQTPKVANSDCTIQVMTLLQIPGAEPLDEDEVFDCEIDPSDADGKHGQMRKIKMNRAQKKAMKKMLKDGDLVPGHSKLKIKGLGVGFDDREMKIPSGLNVKAKVEKSGDKHSHDLFDRRLNGDMFGQKPMAVVKVIDVNGLQRPESPSEIGDDIFGTNGDSVNLKSQLHACSMGKLDVQVGVPEHEALYEENAPGVFQVTLDISLQDHDQYFIHDAVTAKVAEVYGINLPGPYEHVMYVIERCYNDCGWAAYAYPNSWMSVYQMEYYKHAAVQLHELGHNFGFGHSGGLNGATYSDHTGLMGNPLFYDDIGNMCFNAAKSWQVGWYDDRKLTINPTIMDANWSEQHTLVGIADYNHPTTQNLDVLIKLETGTWNDYFIGFNRAVGVNSDNVEADNELTIVTTGANGEGYTQSWLKAHLVEGESYEITDYFTTPVTVRLIKIDKPANAPWRATLVVGNNGSTPPPTISPGLPTPSPTPAPTPPPTTVQPTDAPSLCTGVEIIVDLLTDKWPSETSWSLFNMCTNKEQISVSRMTIYQTANTQYVNTYCVPPAEYTFTVNDTFGDGFCCSYGTGAYTITVDGDVAASGGEFGYSETKSWGSCDVGNQPTNNPTPLPTNQPTAKPVTPPPTPSPTKAPTNYKPTPPPTNQITTTNEPTTSPTSHITATNEPTPSPTNQLTVTNEPTPSPTTQLTVTNEPTLSPTNKVTTTNAPTPSPTNELTATDVPTPSPTNEPTATNDPTPSPTNKVTTNNAPTPSPTNKITATNEPTPSPTNEITATNAPTPSPTNGLTATSEPTPSPTDQLTASNEPTPPPTNKLTATNAPTLFPTNQLTATNAPTPSPTNQLTATNEPTPSPTNQLTTLPPTPTGGQVTALFNPGYGAPACSSAGASCTSGQLLDGKANTIEPNAPNTLDECVDGPYGSTYHYDESIDSITVAAVGGGQLRAGGVAEIQATVWPYGTGSFDTADFYYAADASDPTWVPIGSVAAGGSGLRTLTVQYLLPSDDKTQAVRVNFRFLGDQSPCTGGKWDDVDDLVFSVAQYQGTATMKPIPPAQLMPINSSICSSINDRSRCDGASLCEWRAGRGLGSGRRCYPMSS